MSESMSPRMSRRTLCRGLGTALVSGASASWAALVPRLAWASDWEKIDDDDGIVVYRKDMPESSLHAFRGTALVDAPLEKVLWVLADNTHRTEWVDRLQKSVILEKKGPYEFIVYQHFSSPPVISDRDFVYRARAYSTADGTAVLDIASVHHRGAPPSVGVRGELKFSSYRLQRRGDKTYVDVAIALDPKGSLPAWVVNLVQKSWPRKTLSGLRRQVKKPFVGTLAPPPQG